MIKYGAVFFIRSQKARVRSHNEETLGAALAADSTVLTSDPSPSHLRSSEQSRWLYRQHQKEDDEADHILVARRNVDRADRLGDSQNYPARERPRHAPHPAEHHDDERLERERSASVWLDAIID